MVDLMEEGERRARKEHRCYDCQETIPVGERHYFQTTVDGGSIATLRSHRECRAALLWYISEAPPGTYDDGVPPLWEEIEESGEEAAILEDMEAEHPDAADRLRRRLQCG